MPTATLSGFANPSNEFRPWPFFVLNDEYLPGSGEGGEDPSRRGFPQHGWHHHCPVRGCFRVRLTSKRTFAELPLGPHWPATSQSTGRHPAGRLEGQPSQSPRPSDQVGPPITWFCGLFGEQERWSGPGCDFSPGVGKAGVKSAGPQLGALPPRSIRGAGGYGAVGRETTSAPRQ
jgi:hypothetical protein